MKKVAFILFISIVTASSVAYSQSDSCRLISIYDTTYSVGDYLLIPKTPDYFGFEWPTQDDTTYNYLMPFAVFLGNNPQIRLVEIAVYMDSRPIPMTTDTLSLRKASLIKDLLILRNNISPERLVAHGYGGNTPRVIESDTIVTFLNYPREKKCANARLFVKKNTVLDDQFIDALTDDCQKELAHYLNRRTLMRILKVE